MTCQEVIENMQRQLDGDLSEFEVEALMKHNRHCPDCAAMFERLTRLSAELESLPKVAPPFSLVDSILPQLDEVDRLGQQQAPVAVLEHNLPAARKGRKNRFSWRAVSGVAAAAVVAGLFLITYRPDPIDTAGEIMQQSASSANYDTMAGDHAARMMKNEEPAAQDNAVQVESAMNGEATGFSANEDSPPPTEPVTSPSPAEAPEPTVGPSSEGQAGGSSGGSVETETKSGTGSGNGQDDAGVIDGDRGVVTPSSNGNANSGAENGVMDGGAPASEEWAGTLAEQTEKELRYFEDAPMEEGVPVPPSSDMAAPQSLAPEKMHNVGATSPDGQYYASFADSIVQVFTVADHTLLFESRPKQGTLEQMIWSEDSGILEYVIVDADGQREKYTVIVSEGTEDKG